MRRNPRRWWEMVKKLGMTGASERWRKYFEKLLNDGGRLGVQEDVRVRKQVMGMS